MAKTKKEVESCTDDKVKAPTSRKKATAGEDPELECTWAVVDALCDRVSWDRRALENTVRLLDEDNTVPFIARYRKEQTGCMEADMIRQVKDDVEMLRSVQAKVKTVYQNVTRQDKVKPDWLQALAAAQTLAEVEHLYAPFKPGSKRSHAERARQLGLEPSARKLITEPWTVNSSSLVRPAVDGLATLEDVQIGIQHILADLFSKDKGVMDCVRKWCDGSNVLFKSEKKVTKEASKTKAKSEDQKRRSNQDEADKYRLYFDFSCSIKFIKPHQVLAINRGVSKKLLTSKIIIPSTVKDQVMQMGERTFINPRCDKQTRELFSKSIRDSCTRLIEPVMERHYRSVITKMAEKASIEVFASNLKRLLLMPPVRGKVVLGVDPGFKHGCKYAVVSISGQILDTGVFYPHCHGQGRQREENGIIQTVLRHRCETVAIGNGTACRETEAVFSDLIKRRAFSPLQVMFCIVSESGASIYSASPQAVKELPDLDVSIRGAVSIARRLQDPMAELVKIEPKHIGVGMYQHDIGEVQLKVALDGVVEDCVSFVGVDLNVASEPLLCRIAGLSSSLAQKVIHHRETKGPFINREQLCSVKGLGPKTFKQCAGFVRVIPQTVGTSSTKDSSAKVEAEAEPTPVEGSLKRKAGKNVAAGKSKKAKMGSSMGPEVLDRTSIHPESYPVADRLISKVGLSKESIGTREFTDKTKQYMMTNGAKIMDNLAVEFDVGVPTLTQIVQALQQPLGHDMRDEFEKPLFKESVRNFSDLRRGDKLTGRVTNTVHFGAFVDVGVGRDGLLHSSQIHTHKLGGKNSLELGDRVKVIVGDIDARKNRFQLKLDGLST